MQNTEVLNSLVQQWGVLFATLISPLLAVVVTLWYQRRDRSYQLKLGVFTKLMQLRRNKISAEYVGALNLVPVVFHSNTAVTAAFREVLRATSDPNWSIPSNDPRFPEVMERLSQQLEAVTVVMLELIAKDMQIGIDQLTVLQGAYEPKGWSHSQQFDADIKKRVLEVFAGERPLPVIVVTPNLQIQNDDKQATAVSQGDVIAVQTTKRRKRRAELSTTRRKANGQSV